MKQNKTKPNKTNPVAKHLKTFNRPVVIADKKKEQKKKGKQCDEYEEH